MPMQNPNTIEIANRGKNKFEQKGIAIVPKPARTRAMLFIQRVSILWISDTAPVNGNSSNLLRPRKP